MKVISLLILTCSLFGSIVDVQKHESNQKILEKILKEELATQRSAISAEKYLLLKVHEIAKKLVENGFSADAYSTSQEIEYDAFPLWEGKTIPATFFVYVWPSQEAALQLNPNRGAYGTTIHSHPIPCALAVLDGSLIQQNFEKVEANLARAIGEETFNQFEGPIDDLKEPFIHRIYSKASPALSLHIYGLPTAEKVYKCFEENYLSHTFREE